MAENQKVSKAELKQIRDLEDFDLIMLISEIHDQGWPMARCTLCLMPGGSGVNGDLREFRKRQQEYQHAAKGRH